jgi:hypothetical protein
MTDERKLELQKLRTRINWFCENKINAFSPTISPAPKHVEKKEIESIEQAIVYFFDKGVYDLVIQRKYMGSYCDIYLTKDIENTYFVSRNGYKINHIDIEEAKKSVHSLHDRFDWDDVSLMIIQSEMMPWSVLGKGLIDKEFLSYLQCHKNHLKSLQTSSLYDNIEKAKASESFNTFIKDKTELTQEEMNTKYPSHIRRQYEALNDFKILSLDEYEKNILIYDKQLSHFGVEDKVNFKPFNIHKIVYDNGNELLPNNNLSYEQVNDDPYCRLITKGCFDDIDELEKSIEESYQFFEHLTANMEEGIVIKPRIAYIKGLPPALKVRNNDYLSMIYGVDFKEKYDYHFNKRNIDRKLECSINDWEINHRLLQIPYNSINQENYYLKNLVYDRIQGEQAESTLDTRL